MSLKAYVKIVGTRINYAVLSSEQRIAIEVNFCIVCAFLFISCTYIFHIEKINP